MSSFFFEERQESRSFTAMGSSGRLTQGHAITKEARGIAPVGWVSRDTTMILGCHPEGTSKETVPSSAEWVFDMGRRLGAKTQGAILYVCCDRPLGGLHSETEGAIAHVLMNDCEVDVIGLRDKPQGHDDFFHRVARQPVPEVPLINHCGTVYSFNVPLAFLTRDGTEKATLRIDREVRWDIDHVILIVRYAKNALRGWVIGVVFWVLGAAAGEVWRSLVDLFQ